MNPKSAFNLRILIALLVLAQIGFNGGRLVFVLFAIHLQATPATVGLLIGLIGLGPMLQSILLGRWVDKVSDAKPIAIGLASLLIGLTLPALYPSIRTIGIACIFVGSGFMLVHMTISNSVGHAVVPDLRSTAFGHLAVGSSIASTIGPLLSGYLIDLKGHAYTLIILAFFGLAALVLLSLKSLRLSSPIVVAPVESEIRISTRVLDLIQDSNVRAVLIVSGLSTFSWDLYGFLMPLHASKLGMNGTTIGLIMGSFGIAALLARLATPYISRWFTPWQIMASTLAVAASVYLLLPVVSVMHLVVSLSLLLGFGLGFAQPVVMTLIYLNSPLGRTGEVIGIRTTLLNASQTILPWSAGIVGTGIGIASIFWVAAPAIGFGAWYANEYGKRSTQNARNK